jgi:uncharacterized integral membrane protein
MKAIFLPEQLSFFFKKYNSCKHPEMFNVQHFALLGKSVIAVILMVFCQNNPNPVYFNCFVTKR